MTGVNISALFGAASVFLIIGTVMIWAGAFLLHKTIAGVLLLLVGVLVAVLGLFQTLHAIRFLSLRPDVQTFWLEVLIFWTVYLANGLVMIWKGISRLRRAALQPA